MKYEILAHNLKKYRKAFSLTQKQLGEKIFKSEISIRKYESGNTNVPDSTLNKIAEVFNITVTQLLYVPITEEDLESLIDENIKTTSIDLSEVSTQDLILELNKRSDFPINISLK